MPSPWEVLGLESDQRDERAIRRAYARLLKQHRPDQDPEGFRRVHDAYQRALRMVEDDDDDDDDVPAHPLLPVPVVAAASTMSSVTAEVQDRPAVEERLHPAVTPLPPAAPAVTPPPPADEPTPAVPSSPSVIGPSAAGRLVDPSTPWDRAMADLEVAVGQPSGPLRDEALNDAFRRLTRLVTQRQGDAAVLVSLLERHLPGGRRGWRHILSDDDLLAELRRGESELAGHTLRGCFEAGDWQRLRTFAGRWMETDADELQAGDAIALTRVLAVWLAPFDYALADRLVGHLPLRLRRNVDHELDTLLAVGRDLAPLPEASRAYLCALLAGHQPPGDERLRWRTGALVSRLSPDALGRRLVEQRAAGHFSGLVSQVGGINLLSVGFIILGAVLWIVGVSAAASVGERNAWGGFEHKILLWVSLLAALPVFLLLRWWYRALLPWYQASLRPWLWQHLGPFDATMWFSLLYLWLGLGIPLSIQDVLPEVAKAAWILGMPFAGVVLIHHLRRRIAMRRAHLPPWGAALAGIRELLREMSRQFTVWQALRWMGRVSVWVIGSLPALLGAAIGIGGLAWCRPLSVDGKADVVLTALFWSGPFVSTALTLHALNHAWWLAGRSPWWRPLVPLAWCGWIPLLPWLVTWGPVWSGHVQVPPGWWITAAAVAVAVCLPLVARRWWRPRRTTVV